MDWCSILPWLIGIGSAILGGLIGYYLARPKILLYKSKFEDKSMDYDSLNNTYNATLSAKAEADKLNTNLNASLEAKTNRVNSLQVSLDEELALRQKLEGDVERGVIEIKALNERIAAKNVTISDMEASAALALSKANDEFAAKEAKLKANLDAKDVELKAGAEKMSFASSSNQSVIADLEAKLAASAKDCEGKVASLNASLEGKDAELNALQVKLGELKANFAAKESDWNLKIEELEAEATANLSSRGIAMGSGAMNTDEFSGIKANLGLIPFGNIGSSASVADDLEKINSISATDEMKLNLAQINSYKQLSRLQDEEISAIANATGIDADRIKSEDWVGQARLLLAGAVTQKDDLTKIEGIGPKISGLCNNNGIYSFGELANTSVTELKHVLKEGGNRYRLANPGTWPMQARLAADGEWEQLRILQDVLDGGVFRDGKAEEPVAARGIVMEASPINMDEIANIKANLGDIPFGSIGSPSATADDLEQINSISAIDEMKLNLAQINSYKQLSRLQDEEIDAIANATGIDADRIKSEGWGNQARQLLAAAIVDKDDLKKIEGIGPKISELCNNNGIYTFEELANTAVTALQHVLKEGGKRFRLANPSSWPMQARLAADGEWEQLEILQDILDGGVFKR